MQTTSRFTTGLLSLCCGVASLFAAAGCSGTSDGAPVQVTTTDEIAPRCFAKDLTDEFGLGDCDQGHSAAAANGGGDNGDLFDGLGEGGKDGSWTKRNPQPKSAGKSEEPGGDCADSCKDEAEACVSACDLSKSLVAATSASCKAQCAARHGRCMITCLGRNGLP